MHERGFEMEYYININECDLTVCDRPAKCQFSTSKIFGFNNIWSYLLNNYPKIKLFLYCLIFADMKI